MAYVIGLDFTLICNAIPMEMPYKQLWIHLFFLLLFGPDLWSVPKTIACFCWTGLLEPSVPGLASLRCAAAPAYVPKALGPLGLGCGRNRMQYAGLKRPQEEFGVATSDMRVVLCMKSLFSSGSAAGFARNRSVNLALRRWPVASLPIFDYIIFFQDIFIYILWFIYSKPHIKNARVTCLHSITFYK